VPKCLGSEVSWVRSVLTPTERGMYVMLSCVLNNGPPFYTVVTKLKQ